MPKTLPEKPSELLTIALADLEKAEKAAEYEIDMDVYHSPQPDGKCQVCLAGTVMAFSLEADINEIMLPNYFEPETEYRLQALDFLRRGNLTSACMFLHLVAPCDRFAVREYESDPAGFKRDIRDLITYLTNNSL